jgi:hypothetical protein
MMESIILFSLAFYDNMFSLRENGLCMARHVSNRFLSDYLSAVKS